MSWQPLHIDGTKRVGNLQTRSGAIPTPFFMPDATRAAVRGVTSAELAALGIPAVVVNTYHLLLQPGAELVAQAGGIHALMDWPRPVLSDSGGYQVYSLIHKNRELGKITEEGAHFKSPRDGATHLLTPERSIQIQFELGVDMLVCLDDPRPNGIPLAEAEAAVARTTRWAERCKEEYERQCAARGLSATERPLLFGVVQGGLYPELRERASQELAAIGFDGYGFGGRHIDEAGSVLRDILQVTAAAIPEDKPRFALGIGTPADIVLAHSLGWDMFDCVIPTREGRHGRLFINRHPVKSGGASASPIAISQGKPAAHRLQSGQAFYETINITNQQFREDFSPVDPTCDCILCTRYTRSYLRHLFAVEEPLAGRLASVHNLRFYATLMERLRTP